MNIYFTLFIIIVTLFISIGSIPIIVKIAKKKNILDEPEKRKSHHTPIPTIGGVSIYLSLITSVFFINYFIPFHSYAALILAITILLFIGLKDDILNSTPISKLLMQIVSFSVLIFFADVRFTNLYGFMGFYEISFIPSMMLTLFVMISITNSINLIDGVDGLASGIGMLVSLFLGIWFYLSSNFDLFYISISLFVSLLVFFRYNVFGKKNKIFMGDTGSMLLGFIIGYLVINFNELNLVEQKHHFKSAPAISFGLLALPLLDTLKVIVIRLKNKQSPIHPDKNHIHHNLVQLGLSHIKTSLIVILISLVFFLFSLSLQQLKIEMQFLLILFFGLASLLIIYNLKRKK